MNAQYVEEIRIPTIIYFAAAILWNALFYVMFLLGWLEPNSIVYVLPWGIGNMFFLANMIFSRNNEVNVSTDDKNAKSLLISEAGGGKPLYSVLENKSESNVTDKVQATKKHNLEIFEWFERRAIVAERNTQMLMGIIAFLLPICAALFGEDAMLPASIAIIFFMNITCAAASIGLIWVPQSNIKFMSLLKSLKTVFHLLTVSLLLLSAIMIINLGLLGG